MGDEGLTVYCVCVGNKYTIAYVHALKEMVSKNLTVPHSFKCITDQEITGIETVPPAAPYQGWWSKLNLFKMATGRSLYFDLDVVITGNIDYLSEYSNCKIAAPANWARSGHGGLQSSVMAWDGTWTEPFHRFDYDKDSKRLWGDQEFLWEMLGNDWIRIPHIGSYKYHVRPEGEIPDWMKVCVFHGLPDPHEVNDTCILRYTSTLHSLIKSSTRNGSSVALIATA